MNIPSKIAKSNYLLPDKVQEHQAAASKYYKQYTKLRKRSGEGEALNAGAGIPSSKISSRKSSLNQTPSQINSNSLKEEIITWFFSLDIITKLIISSIENKWVTNLLHQLYIHQKYQPNLRFQIKEGDLVSVSGPTPQTEYTAQILRVSLADNPQSHGNSNVDCFSYLQYFSNKEEFSSLNNYCGQSAPKTQEEFLNELKFYKSEDLILNEFNQEKMNKYCNYFTLSEKILQDEKLFRYYFDKLSSEQAFLSLIPSSYDNTLKHHSIYLPEWIKNKDYYSAAEIFLAFFEQVITVKYIIHKHNPNQVKLSSHLEQLLKEKEESTDFIKKSKKNYKELFQLIKEKNIIKELFYDSDLNANIKAKLYQGNAHIYFTFTNFNFEDVVFDKENMEVFEIERKLEKFLQLSDFDEDISKFLDKLLFFKIDKIYSYDDFLMRKIFEFISELRQKESFDDLMNDDLEDLICNTGSTSRKESLVAAKVSKKKKKKKVNTAEIKNSDIKIPVIISEIKNPVKNSEVKNAERKNSNIIEIENIQPLQLESLKENNPSKTTCGTSAIAKANEKEEKKYAFSFIKRKPENKESCVNSSNGDEYTSKEFLGNVMLIKKQISKEEICVKKNNITQSGKNENFGNFHFDQIIIDLVEEIVSTVCFKMTFETSDYEKDVPFKNEKNEKSQKNKEEISEINSTHPNLTINTNNIHNYVADKLSSPTFSEKCDQNDTDTAYSSEGTTSATTKKVFEKEKKKKKDKNKFFLYNVNKAPKKVATQENSITSTNSNSLITSGNINSAPGNNLSSPRNAGNVNINNQIKNEKIENNKNSTSTNNIKNSQNCKNKFIQPLPISNNPLSRSANNNSEKINTNVFITNTNKIFKNEKNEENANNLNVAKNKIINGINTTFIPGNQNQFEQNKFTEKSIDRIEKEKEMEKERDNFFSKRHNSANDQTIKDEIFMNSQSAVYNNIADNFLGQQQVNDNFKYQGKRKYSSGNNYSKYSKVNVNVNVFNVNNVQNYNNFNYNYNPTFNNYYPQPNIPNMFNFMPGPGGIQMNNMGNNMNTLENFIPFQHPFMNAYTPGSSFFPGQMNFNPSPNDFFLTHNPIAFEFFQFKLHKDILDFCENTENTLRTLKPFKAGIMLYLENHIKDFLLKEFNLKCSLEVYGSFASEMDIETSDMDVTVKFEDMDNSSKLDIDYSFIMKKLVDYLYKLKTFDSVNPIYTASVPVIKLHVDPLNVLEETLREKFLSVKESDIYKNYKFCREEIDKVKIDLTFSEDIKKKNKNINVSQKHVEMIKNSCIVFPELKPLIKILKRFLNSNKLNCTFNGRIFEIFLINEFFLIYFFRWTLFFLFIPINFSYS
jgi:hypothetical protein